MKQEQTPIKRRYPTDDFNPYKVVEWFYNNVGLDTGANIVILGYTERFNSILKATYDVCKSKGLPLPSVIPVGRHMEVTTHLGSVIRLVGCKDGDSVRFYEHLDWASHVGLTSEYNEPVSKNIIREQQPTTCIYDFSKNNQKDVD